MMDAPSYQEEESNQAFYRELAEAASTKDLIVMGDFNYLNICWGNHSASSSRSTNFLATIDDLFLTQAVERPTRSKATLDLVLTKEEDVVTHQLDVGQEVDIIYLDFSKAFDTVSHEILSTKLKDTSLNQATVSNRTRAPRGGGRYSADAALWESVKRFTHLNSLSSNDNTTAFYGFNQFSHLFPEEFKAIYLRSRPDKLPKYTEVPNRKETPLPKKFDWRDENVVTEVKNQNTCGGCWAFSVVGGIESAYAIKRNNLEELSVQQVIDCSYNNYGCSGGSTVSALNWLNQTQVKLVKNSEYSFKGQTGLCHYFSLSDFGVSITGYAAYDFSGQEEEMMRKLVHWGPLAVTVDAISWQDYLGGIIQHHCSSGKANHAVLVTGFDRTGIIPYWIVRNSWGRTWGIDGYARIKIGGNMCGIADTVASVFV
ncbi:PREDICTED: cathepsin O [Gavialis gangeticus]|uniref:cathepsin O n=1 Tax=Gavialis gangeticus TaxID=94835 RepID=UPI00092E7B58|nr:PREDICTED: cathepsin O [Gavialis gangeticus]